MCDVLIEEEHDIVKQIKFNNKLIDIDKTLSNKKIGKDVYHMVPKYLVR